nr:GNAT family N-acetyltransferase [Salinibacillus kushneri]
MQFEKINIDKHRDYVIQFRKDSFVISFGNDSNFDEGDYLRWLEEKIVEYPEGFVIVREGDQYIGQLELSIRNYENKSIGYVHLYYLIPEKRGKGKGQNLHDYVKQFFKSHNIQEFHLRVSPTNTIAMRFYHKMGIKVMGPELGGKVIRMKGYY